MELTIPQQQMPVAVQFPEAKSLKTQCLAYIGNNAQHKKINLIDNLINLPADLASAAIVATNTTYIDQNKAALIKLAQSTQLDRNVSCAIAQKCGNVALARELAKNGPITDGVASILVKAFLDTDMAICLNDFDGAFNKAFPEKILNHGNHNLIYQELMNKITNEIYEVEWKHNDASLLFAQDFKHNLSTEKITHYAAHKSFINKNFDAACAYGFVALSPCKNFLAFIPKNTTNKTYNAFEIHNLKNGKKTKVLNSLVECPHILIDAITFSQDCSLFGIQDKNGNIYSFEFTSMLFNDVSLQKLASLSYCYTQFNKKYHISFGSKTGLGYRVFQNNSHNKCDEEIMLINFTCKNIIADTKSLPAFIRKRMSHEILTLESACIIIGVLDTASQKLQMTKKEIATKWFINQDQQFVHDFAAILRDNFDTVLPDINKAFLHLYNYMHFLLK